MTFLRLILLWPVVSCLTPYVNILHVPLHLTAQQYFQNQNGNQLDIYKSPTNCGKLIIRLQIGLLFGTCVACYSVFFSVPA